MNRIDGKALAASIREDVRKEIARTDARPRLGVLLVGDDPASHIYVNLKEKAAHEAGIETEILLLPADTPDSELIAQIENWNADEATDAILIQLPLPAGHDTDAVVASMDPKKDVDGFHPQNHAALLRGESTLFPPVHEAVLRLIGVTDTDLRSARAVIIANSETFAAPLSRLLSQAGCAVEIFSSEDVIPRVVQNADIVVVAVGRPKFLTRDMITSGACVIDVGTTRLPDGSVVGDVDAQNVNDIPGWLSPVPGGVGPVTVALLLKNTLELSKKAGN